MTGSQAALGNAFTRQAQLGNHFRSQVQLGNEWKKIPGENASVFYICYLILFTIK